MIIKKYELFKEASSEIGIGTMTNMGRVVWMDNPSTDHDISVKTDMFNPKFKQDFTWCKLSELVPEINPESEETIAATTASEGSSTIKPEIEFTDLMKCDIRVCSVTTAEKIKGKDRLLVLKINTGFDERQVVTNLGGSYAPEDLQGKKFAFVLNLKPAKIAKLESNGMIIAAEDEAKKQYLVEINAPVGTKVL